MISHKERKFFDKLRTTACDANFPFFLWCFSLGLPFLFMDLCTDIRILFTDSFVRYRGVMQQCHDKRKERLGQVIEGCTKWWAGRWGREGPAGQSEVTVVNPNNANSSTSSESRKQKKLSQKFSLKSPSAEVIDKSSLSIKEIASVVPLAITRN